VARLQMSPPVQSALVVQSCRSPTVHVAAHFDVAAVPRVAAVSQQMPVAQLFVPEHAKAPALQAAVVVHAGRAPLPVQQTSVAELHGVAPQAICPAPPSVPRGGVVIPPPSLPPPLLPPASMSTLASSAVMPPSSPAGDASSPMPLLPELVPPPELLPTPELLAVPELLPAPELAPPAPPSSPVVSVVVEPDPLQPIAITTDAPRNVRKADIEVPPRTFFAVSAVSSGAQWSVGSGRLHKCDARSA
jgi:hypothetical protein